MKVFILSDTSTDWCPKNQLYEFRKWSTFQFTDTPEDAEIIWILAYYLPLDQFMRNGWLGFFRHRKSSKRTFRDKLTITSFGTHLYRRKESIYLPMIQRVDAISDIIHFFCERNILANLDYFKRPILHLPYWIDSKKFFPLSQEHRLQLRRSLEIPTDKIIIGSFQRDTEADLVSPKLEKGPDIFCDALQLLEKEKYFVLLSGPRRNYVENRLTNAGISFKNLGQVPHSQMNALYNAIDFYFVTSRAEGGPQAILESMATRTKIYSTPVGVSDMLNQSVVVRDAEELSAALSRPYPDVLDLHLEKVNRNSIDKIIPIYEKTFGDVYVAFQRRRKKLVSDTPHLRWYNTGHK